LLLLDYFGFLVLESTVVVLCWVTHVGAALYAINLGFTEILPVAVATTTIVGILTFL